MKGVLRGPILTQRRSRAKPGELATRNTRHRISAWLSHDESCRKTTRADERLDPLDAIDTSNDLTRAANRDDGSQAYDTHTYSAEIRKIREAEDRHFWFTIRNEIIAELFRAHVPLTDRCIEVGAGTGGIASFLDTLGYRVAVGEPHHEGIAFAREAGIKEVYQFDIFKQPFKGVFDVVCLFDVLEHLHDDGLALESVGEMMRPSGRIVISVPAHSWLWCRDDDESAHYRRYELRQLESLLAARGYRILYGSARFISLLPLLFLRSKLRLYSPSIEINPLLDFVLRWQLRLENWLMRRFHLRARFGGTIFIVAEKSA